jgi:hypothetical protein
MLATYWNSLTESLNRRAALVLLGVALLIAGLLNSIVRVKTFPDGAQTLAVGSQTPGPVETAVPDVLESELRLLGPFLPLLAIFAASPLLTATLEKGWLELIFSKGVSRWKIFLGRFLGGVTLYAFTFFLATVPLAYRLWWQTYVPTWRIVVALAMETFGFVALLSVIALAALMQKGITLPIIGSVAIWLLSPLLRQRHEVFYPILPWRASRWVVDGMYLILPKCADIESLCSHFVRTGSIASWSPLWSTGIFACALMALSVWLLERKSF